MRVKDHVGNNDEGEWTILGQIALGSRFCGTATKGGSPALRLKLVLSNKQTGFLRIDLEQEIMQYNLK